MQLAGAGQLFSQTDFVHQRGEASVHTLAVVDGIYSGICCPAAGASGAFVRGGTQQAQRDLCEPPSVYLFRH